MCTFNIFSVTSIKELLEWQLTLKRKYNNSNMAASWEVEYGIDLGEVGKSFTERKSNNPDQESVVGIDMPYLRQPWFLDAQYIDKATVQKYLIPAINFMAKNTAQHIWNSHQGFEDYELQKLKRIVIQILTKIKAVEAGDNIDTILNRAKFYDFVNQLDARNGTNFLETFPEMKEFYLMCGEMTESKHIVKDKNV
jgi:hypothetical protein